MGLLMTAGAANWASTAGGAGEGTLGAAFGPRTTEQSFKVLSLEPGSPLAAAGVKVGDAVRFARLGDRRRLLTAGETIALDWGSTAGWKSLRITTVATAGSRSDQLEVALLAAASLLALALALALGWKRSDQPSVRYLALALLTLPHGMAASLMAGGDVQDFLARLRPLGFAAAYLFFVVFSLRFPDGNDSRAQRRLRRVLPAYVALGLGLGLSGTAGNFGLAALDFVGGPVAPTFAVLSVVLSLAGLAFAWRDSSGMTRTRVAWVAVSMGLVYTAYMAANVFALLGLYDQFNRHAYVQGMVILASLAGLAYGLLRHRVFDFGFAVNRALVYAVVSAVLLVSFGLLEWIAHKLVHFEDQQKSGLLDAGIAITVFLAFHKVRHWAEGFIERLFFQAWHLREQGLRRFVRHAAHMTAPGAVMEALCGALRDFTGGASCTVYGLENGAYRALGGAAPDRQLDDPVAVALRAEAAPVLLDEAAVALALPMANRGVLGGLVLLGPKPGGESYRPDELELLGWAVQQVGFDLHALEVERLRDELDAARNEAQVLRSVIQVERVPPQPAPAE